MARKPTVSVGDRFERLLVTEEAPKPRPKYPRTWHCLCDCGNTSVVQGGALKRGEIKSCGCHRRQLAKERAPVVHTGDEFGRLVVIAESERRINTGRVYLCQCECGNELEVSSNSLRTGHTRSCGCLEREVCAEKARELAKTCPGKTHGYAPRGIQHPVYSTWTGMIARCTNPNATGYKYWGGRGITVCQHWRTDFAGFLTDMGERPAGRSIDRVNNEGNYSCGHCEQCIREGWLANCRWATPDQQSKNRRPHGTV